MERWSEVGRGGKTEESGFTILELTIVMAIMAIVLVIAGSAVVSYQNVTSRTSAMIDVEQSASSTLALVARDIRSAHSITFPTASGSTGTCPQTTNAANTVILNENQPSTSATTPVEWIYQPPVGSATVGTFCRVTLNSNLTPKTTQVMLSNLSNPSSTPVFTYYDLQGQPIPLTGTVSTVNQTLQTCSTAIGVTLAISPSPIPNVATFTESNEVAITDQQQLLSAPGNGQCG